MGKPKERSGMDARLNQRQAEEPDPKSTAPVLDKRQRLREIEKKAKEAAAIAEEEEEAEERKKREERMKKRTGIIRLGPVMAREEKVEPYKTKAETQTGEDTSAMEAALAAELEQAKNLAEAVAKAK